MSVKTRRLCFLLALCLLLAGCSAGRDSLPESTSVPGTSPILPSVDNSGAWRTREEAILWFRFQDEPYLAQESRPIQQLTGQSYEMALLTALFAGPGIQHVELNSPFAQGTRVISATKQGRCLQVTLSREFLNGLSDEPEDWRSDPTWQLELPLRRRLAMQSLVATITENCDVDEVVVFVEQDTDDAGSMRLPQSWFMEDSESGALAGPQTRDDACLLTPTVTGEAIMACLRQRNWQRLYLYIASGSEAGASELTYQDFVSTMQALPALMSYGLSGCSVNMDGLEAILTVSIQLRRSSGQLLDLSGRILRLQRDSGIWKVTLQDLTGWMED